ncbi:MAG: hypothetical protein J6I64_09385 [Lachnospiraceae bacterium]|nr:hypothetical protein [Lachnospiraceae bacterium]
MYEKSGGYGWWYLRRNHKKRVGRFEQWKNKSYMDKTQVFIEKKRLSDTFEIFTRDWMEIELRIS